MDKIKKLAEKLKKFTFYDIAILAEAEDDFVEKELKRLVQEEVLKEIKQGYVFNVKSTEVVPPVNLGSQNHYFCKNSTLLESARNARKVCISAKDDEAFKNAPDFNKAKALKYISLIKRTHGLYGKKLRRFINKYNEQNPGSKTSYASLMRARRIFAHKGKSGLISSYGKGKGKSCVHDIYYKFFKELYLSPLRLSVAECVKEVQDSFLIPQEEMPSVVSFSRRLHREMPPEQIKAERNGICF
jgi:hypothetical protein